MKILILILATSFAVSACSWVDSTGSQSNVTPQNDSGAALLQEREVYQYSITDDNDVEAKFLLQLEGQDAAADCNNYLPRLESATSLAEACDLSVPEDQCSLEFVKSADKRNTYDANIPKLRRSVALRYQVLSRDINGASDEADITLCLKAVNDAPKAVAHIYQVEYKGTLETSDAIFDENCQVVSGSGVLSGASDDFDFASAPVDGDAACLSAELLTPPQSATDFTLNPLGGFSYEANGSLAPGASDSFEYAVSDGELSSETAVVTVLVIGDNNPPLIRDIDTLIVDENGTASITVASLAEDPEGEPLKLFAIGDPENGSTRQDAEGTTIEYSPNDSYVGADQFSFTVQDIAGATASGQVDVLVARVNRTPEIKAPASRQYDFEDSAASIQYFDVSVDDLETAPPQLQVSVSSSNTAVATASGPRAIAADGTAAIALNPLSNGTTTLTITVSDTGLQNPDRAPESGSAEVFVSIEGINTNRAPVAQNTSRDVQQGGTLSLDLNDISSDADRDDLNFRLLDRRAGVSLNGSVLRLTAAATRTIGSFDIDYRVDDGDKSDTGTVSIEVSAKPNTTPVARDGSASVEVGESTTFDLARLSSDSDDDTLSYELIRAPTGVTIRNATVTVSSRATATAGTLRFSYRVDDGTDSATGALTVTVTEQPNSAPTIEDASLSVVAGETASLDLSDLAEDEDNDRLSYAIITQRTGARVSGSTLTVTTSDADAGELVRISYRVSDGTATATGVLRLTVTAKPNTAPTIEDATATVTAGSTATVNLAALADDDDDDTLSYAIITQRTGARVSGSTLTVTTSDADAGELVRISYRVSDGTATATGVLRLTVTAKPNTAPTIRNATATINAGDTASIDLADLASDAEDDTLAYSLTSRPTGASLSGSVLTLQTSTTTSGGIVSIGYRVSDGKATASGTFSVTVTALNSAPETRNVSRDLIAGQTTALDLSTISDDDDGDSLSFSLSNRPSGTAFTSPVISYTAPATASTQTVVINFVVSDGQDEATGSFTVNVQALPPSNTAPIAGNGTLGVSAGSTGSLDLRSISSDPDLGDTLSYSLLSRPAGASLRDGVLSYTAATTASDDTISIGYSVDDGTDSSIGSVTVTVTAGGG